MHSIIILYKFNYKSESQTTFLITVASLRTIIFYIYIGNLNIIHLALKKHHYSL